MFTKDEAIEKIELEFFKNEPNSKLENLIKIIDDATVETSFGWIFSYQNARYLMTKNIEDLSLGNGPIIFNKSTGELRPVYTDYDKIDELIEDYEKELEAGGDSWCLAFDKLEDRKKIVSVSRKIFDLDLRLSLDLIPKSPGLIFFGLWRDLFLLKKLYRSDHLELTLKIAKIDPCTIKEFKPDNDMMWKLRMTDY